MSHNEAKSCRCGHAPHPDQCPAPGGCWCDTYTLILDEQMVDEVEKSAFHQGLAEHGPFVGFPDDREDHVGPKLMPAMTDEEVKASQMRMERLVCS